jgi:hypothetical protein
MLDNEIFFKETYYVPPLNEGPSQKISKGKLVDKYRNQRRALRAAGAIGSQSRQMDAHCSTDTAGNSTITIYLYV